MAATHQQLVRDVFDEVADLPPDLRNDLLRRRCGDNALLRQDVLALLEASESAGSFLSAPELPSELPMTAVDLQPGMRVGPYVVVRVIGEGGFGRVALAEPAPDELPAGPTARLFPDDTPMQVAVKVVRAGMSSAQVLARFREEERSLAKLSHPNIARFYQSGQTASGQPYLAMEFVDGVPVTDFCRSRGLDVAGRIELFLDLCQAVQHAHQKGVIHRDLKPANVLVQARHAKPVLKVIDFGVAKVVSDDRVSRSLTGEAPVPGTLQYMSPEQADGPSDRVDTRTDVYALGAILYELLADTPAFEIEVLRHAGELAARKLIAEAEPPPPSQRLHERASTSESDAAKWHQRARQVRGELDWVVARAMEKDAARRYPTADALADDLRRYLADEPVRARPPSWQVRTRKFVRRHRFAVTTAATVTAAILLGLAGTLAGFRQALIDRDLARQARAVAEEQTRQAEQHRAHAEAQRQAADTQRRIADNERGIADRQRQLAAEQAARASAEAERAGAAQAFMYRLLSPTARPPGVDPHTPVWLLEYLAGRADAEAKSARPDAEAPLRAGLGMAFIAAEDFPRAEKQFRRSLELELLLAGNEPGQNVPSVRANLALALMQQQKHREAEQLLRLSLEGYARWRPDDRGLQVLPRELLGMTLHALGRDDEAATELKKALDDSVSAYGEDAAQTQRIADRLKTLWREVRVSDSAD